MWCAFEKLCKLKPDKIEVGKYFSDINPKILMFNNKFIVSANTNLQYQNNLNNTNAKNFVNSVNLNQPKDFSLSPDNYNQNKIPNCNNTNNNNHHHHNQILNLNKNKAELNNLHLTNLNNLNNNFSSSLNNLNNQELNNPSLSNNNIFLDKNFPNNKNTLRSIIPNPFNSNSNNNINNNINLPNNTNNNNINNNNNNFHNTFTTSNNSVSRFNVLGNKEADDSDLQSSNPSMYNKYQPEFRVFTDNSEAEKQITTPVVNKDKVELDYENMNHLAFIPQKQNNLRPFTYSNSPNQIGQDLNKIICNSELMNNKYGNNNNSSNGNVAKNNLFMSNSGNNNNNNLNSSSSNQNNANCVNNNNLEFKMKFLDSSNIKPFNFNVTGSVNNLNQEFTPKDPQEMQDSSSIIQEQLNYSGNNITIKNANVPNSFLDSNGNNINNSLIQNQQNNNNNNIFQNIQLSTTNANNDFNRNLNNNNNNLMNLSTHIGNANNNLNFSNYFNTNYNNNINNNTKNNNINNNNNNPSNNQNKFTNPKNFLAANKSYETYFSIKRSDAKSEPSGAANNFNFNPGKFSDLGQLLKLFGEILKKLSLYKCKEAIELIEQLPLNHRNSGVALSLLAKAYFELAKYKECEKHYRECLKVEPYRLEGIEYFSSCLWHLKDQYQLCNLANHVLEQSLFAPETWIVLGNSYSLQKEHEVALKFFTRAIQLNPSFAYAYTLCGHEHFSNESYIEAKNFYSKAIGIDEK